MKILKIALILGLALGTTACSGVDPRNDWLSQAPRYASPTKS